MVVGGARLRDKRKKRLLDKIRYTFGYRDIRYVMKLIICKSL